MSQLAKQRCAAKKYLAPRPRQKSQYDRYPLPFFSADARCTWDVTPTGNDTADCETGTAYALLALLFQYQAISTRRQST